MAAALTGVILTGATCWAYWAHGSVGHSLMYLNGESLAVESAVARFGVLQTGKSYETSVQVENIGDRPVSLLGVNATCGCVTLEQFPITLVPRSQHALAIRYVPNADRQSPVFVRVFTDDARRPEIQIQVTAAAVTPDPAATSGPDNHDASPRLEPIASAKSSGR